MTQLLSDLEPQAAQNCDPWEKETNEVSPKITLAFCQEAHTWPQSRKKDAKENKSGSQNCEDWYENSRNLEVARSHDGAHLQRGGSCAERGYWKLHRSPTKSLTAKMQICTWTLQKVWWEVTGRLWAELLSGLTKSWEWESSEGLKLEWNVLIYHLGHSVETPKECLRSITEPSCVKVTINKALKEDSKR